MRYLFGFLCVCALGLMPLVGCSETSGEGGSGGSAGEGGGGGSNSAVFPCTEQGIVDAIAEGGGPHTFSCNGPQTVVTADDIFINNNVILDGEGNLTVDGNEGHRVFSTDDDVTVELRGFSVAKGVSTMGGCIHNEATLTLTDTTISGCTAPDPVGRGGLGGGIFNQGVLTMTNSTVAGNSAEYQGGGIHNFFEGTLTMTNSTVSGNSARAGGGIRNDSLMTITNSTMSGNTAEGGSAILNFEAGRLTVASSVINGGCDSGEGTDEISLGYNIESPGNTCGFDPDGTDLVNVTEGQLNLGELADNGGPTMTHALEAGSVAIDKIPEADCEVDKDQRGQPRPETDGAMCDVGSFELQPPPAEGCTQSGGTVSTASCCQAIESFPNTCTIGACGCGPDASHEVDVCICPANTCFDGESCTALITVTGTVTFFESLDVEGPPAAGATVSAFGTSLRTTTDESGRFSFDVPEGIVFFQAWKEDTWGFLERRHVPKNGTNTDLSVIPDALVAQIAQDLKRDIDETKGIVEPYFDPASGLGGETAMLSEPSDFSFTTGASGNWVLSDELLAGGEPLLAFSGVTVTDELTVTPIGVEGYTCGPRSPEGDPLPSGIVYPVVAKTFTLVPVGCTPVP